MPDAGSVAAQLLDLHAEPVRHRPRLTHGREAFAGGIHAFRFAQGKFPNALLKKFSAGKRDAVRTAARFFVRQVCFWEGATHYQVLGVAANAPLREIREHYQCLMSLIHPDRQDAGDEPWPHEFAQRANKAWAVLSDATGRKDYDVALATSGIAPDAPAGVDPVRSGTSPGAMAVLRRDVAGRPRMRTTLGLASVTLAGLFFAHMWWASLVPPEYETLAGAAPLEHSLRWMRGEGAGVRLPGFLRMAEARPAPDADPAAEPAAASTALTRVSLPAPGLAQRADPLPPRDRIDSAAPLAALPDPRPAASPVSTAPVSSRPSAARAEAARTALAQQARESQPTPAGAVLAEQMPDLEVVVARMVAYYEAGDLERFLGLFDADSMGVLESYRVRSAFSDFFRSTSTRRLHIEQVRWIPAEGRVQAKGRATVTASYREPAPGLERSEDFAIDFVTVAGRPRIARLWLFPRE